MSVRQYIGARYVLKFAGDWDNTQNYEALTVVKYNASSYISKQSVPSGTEISNTDFWLLWADPNAQVAELRMIIGNQFNVDNTISEFYDSVDAAFTDIYNQLSTVQNKKAKILAHRGLSTISSWVYSFDNSSNSFIGALSHGFDGFECDVRKDMNNALVMLHDSTVDSVSTTTGSITELDYTTVYYKTVYTNVATNTHLTSFAEMCEIVKQFDAFAFVEVKDENITPQEIEAEAQSIGLNHSNYGVFITETASNWQSWFEDALDIPNLLVGYFTTDYTATIAEMETLKSIADAHDKPYNEIIVRCVKPNDIQNIKNYGFLCSFEGVPSTTSAININWENVDYSINQGQWNGENDALENYKGRPYRVSASKAAQYETLKDFLKNGISNYLNDFFGRILGSTLSTWLSDLDLNYYDSISNGGFIYGVTDNEFISGYIFIHKTNSLLSFSFDKSSEVLNYHMNEFIRTLTATKLTNLFTDVKAHTANAQHITGYMASAEADSFFNTASTYGCEVEVFTSSACQMVLGYPLNTNQKRIYCYKRSAPDATPTIYYFTGE